VGAKPVAGYCMCMYDGRVSIKNTKHTAMLDVDSDKCRFPVCSSSLCAGKPRVPETVNETQHRVGKDTILALSLAVSGTRGFSAHREGPFVWVVLTCLVADGGVPHRIQSFVALRTKFPKLTYELRY
jgi:hypothetical protein